MRPLILSIIVFISVISAGAAPLKVEVGLARPIAPDLLGINGNLMSLPGASTNEDFLDAFRQTHAGLFRYPAGTIANTWDWDIGGLDPTVPDEDLITWVRQLDRTGNPPHPHGIPEIARIYRETGATISFVLNMLSRDLEHSLRGLRAARAAGVPIRYIEMGNELYFNLPLESRIFPTPEEYGRVCSEWIRAIKAEFPGVQCALVAGGKPHKARSKNWIERALSTCPEADAIVVHVYTPSGLAGPARKNFTAGTEALVDHDRTLPLAERQRQELAKLNTPEGIARVMATAYSAAAKVQEFNTRTSMPIWLTEWNLRDDEAAFRGTWAHTLFTATMFHGLLENPAIEITHYHNVMSPIFGAFYRTAEELDHVVIKDLKSQPWHLTAGGLALQFFARTTTGRVGAEPLNLPSAGTLESAGMTAPTSFGWRFRQAGGSTAIILVNLGEKAQTVATRELSPAGVPVETYSAPVDHYIESNDSVAAQPSTLGDTLSLPPFSVTLINPTPIR
ncbi:MAG: hypothetical protein SynsKO_38490 [Synoicihabitans sp.]